VRRRDRTTGRWRAARQKDQPSAAALHRPKG
jgi:hypothetical protein